MVENEAIAGNAENGSRRRGSRWRTVYWSAASLVLLAPLVAMQVTDEVNWTVFDFVFAGALFFGVGLAYEAAVRKTGDTAYRVAAGVALITTFLLIWVNGAVGAIGSEDNDVNLLYYGVLAVAALVAGWGAPANGPFEVVAINVFFVALWLGAALLFRQAAEGDAEWSTV